MLAALMRVSGLRFGTQPVLMRALSSAAPIKNMFCYQCEQTPGGCTKRGKDAVTAASQDLAQYSHKAHTLGVRDPAIDIFPVETLFSTLTNVNFDDKRIMNYVEQAKELTEKAKQLYLSAATKTEEFRPNLVNYADPYTSWPLVSITGRQAKFGKTIAGLQELIVYGLKGSAAYYDHAFKLGIKDQRAMDFFHEALAQLNSPAGEDVGSLLGLALKVGAENYHVLGLLDAVHNEKFGHPEPTMVKWSPTAGKAILVSGHDLLDLKNILEAAKPLGVNVYTHGEMLPAHGYPELKKYSNLVGHYGKAWQNQREEFDAFPGPIVMTTNCLLEPKNSYADRIYSVGAVGARNVVHLPSRDWNVVVNKALECSGFAETTGDKTVLTGCGHDAVVGLAPKVLDAISAGKIKKFFVIGGCDGAGDGRSYYRELAKALPKEAVVLTLGCAKYRINDLPMGDIDGIPRLLDCGQCNDSYSAIQIALTLSKALNTPLNDLPLYYAISWFEQKAVAVLLTMLHLGIKNIHLGPELPAFLEADALQVLNEKFGLVQISDDCKKDFKL